MPRRRPPADRVNVPEERVVPRAEKGRTLAGREAEGVEGRLERLAPGVSGGWIHEPVDRTVSRVRQRLGADRDRRTRRGRTHAERVHVVSMA